MRSPRRNPLSSADRPSEAGSIALPLLLLSVVLVGAALSTLGYAMLWRSKANLQLRLDRCVEDTARELAAVQNAIEGANLRIRTERAAAVAAAVPTFGGSIRAVQPVLVAEAAYQEAQRMRWLLRQGRWIANRGCDRKGDAFAPLPRLNWSRPPPDGIGPRELVWDGKGPRLAIRLWKANRFSQARVTRSGNPEEEGNAENESPGSPPFPRWKAAWIRRTSLD